MNLAPVIIIIMLFAWLYSKFGSIFDGIGSIFKGIFSGLGSLGRGITDLIPGGSGHNKHKVSHG